MKPVPVEPGVWSLIPDSRQRELRVEPDGEEFRVTRRGRSVRVRVEDPRSWTGATSSKGAAGAAKVASPMPGRVVRVLVEVGHIIEAGQGVVVVEAMKMQNELKSPIAGTVTQVQASEGANVNGKQVLVVVEAHAG
jgi:biotin carboxyl carrier protein